MRVKLAKTTNRTLTEPGDRVVGDSIIVMCRKRPKAWDKIRGSEQHHYFGTTIKMNAKAIIDKKFKNLQKV